MNTNIEVPRILRPEEVAKILGVTVETLATWRSTGAGLRIPFFKLGKSPRSAVRYRAVDVVNALESVKMYENTAVAYADFTKNTTL